MIRFLLRTALTALATFLLLMGLALLLLKTSLGTSFVEDRLRAWVHPKLQINGDVSLSVWPHLGVSVADVTIPSGQGVSPWVSVKQLQWQLAWSPLFSRTLAFDSIYLQGVQVNRLETSWQSMLEQAGQFRWAQSGPWWPSVQTPETDSGAWRLVIEQALIEDVSVTVNDGGHQQLPVMAVEQAQLSGEGAWPSVAGSTASFGWRALSVNDADALGHMPALLEQLGIAQDNAWDVMALDSQWQLAPSHLSLLSLSASGPWGELSAKDGQINLARGTLAIPVTATLTNAPSLNTPGLRIQVRRSVMQFELTGTVAEPGVQWLTAPNQKP
jgi:hypothetical protein